MATHTNKVRTSIHRRIHESLDSDDELFFTVSQTTSLPNFSATSTETPAPVSESFSTSAVISSYDRPGPSPLKKHAQYQAMSKSRESLQSCSSIVDGLLFEIYDRWNFNQRDSLDSDTFTECSSTSDAFFGRSDSIQLHFEQKHSRRLHRAFLESKDLSELKQMCSELKHRTTQVNARLVRQLKRKDRQLAKRHKNYDIITAVLQASSLKRREDTRIRFSIQPHQGDDAFNQWRDAMKAVARLPMGIPPEFRRKVWLSMADSYLSTLCLDWDKTRRFAFNERSNPDDNKLGMQIVKDLHRTGCSGFSGQDNDEDRAILKRVLLAYARWNKMVGYCQGFNVLAALILDVMERKEEDALKVMIYLIDHVLPDSYFANNLSALSVDMAVFRDLLGSQLPQLSKHLDKLQVAARDNMTGANYEPPLTNVFTMQWFLTMFATCLPKDIALRIWDSVLLEGSEILLRTALAIWGKLQSRILAVQSADEFYTTMGLLTQEMLDADIIDADELIKMIYAMGSFPIPQLTDLREKYTYNITPFSAAMSTGRSPKGSKVNIFSDEDDILDDEELMNNIGCFTGILPTQPSPSKLKPLGESDRNQSNSAFDISKVSPGAYEANPELLPKLGASRYMERMTMDIDMLQKQYKRLRQRQQQAHVILATARTKQKTRGKKTINLNAAVAPIKSPVAVNHLFLSKLANQSSGKNKTVGQAPQIAAVYPRAGVPEGPLDLNSLSNHETTFVGPATPKHKRQFSDCSNISSEFDCAVSVHSVESGSSDVASPLSGTSGARSGITDLESVEEGSKSETDFTGSAREIQEDEDSETSNSNLIDFGDGGPLEGRSFSGESEMTGTSESLEASPSSSEQNTNDNHTKEEIKEKVSESESEKSAVVTDTCETNVETDNEPSESKSVELDSNGKDILIDGKKATLLEIAELSKKGELNIEVKSTDNTERGQTSVDPSKSQSQKGASPLTLSITQKVSQSSGNDSSHSSDQGSTGSSGPSSPVKAGKTFNPFPSRHMNAKRAQNGIKLGLYSPDNVPVMERGAVKTGGVKNITRAQINACLHRQYMAEVKRQAKASKH